MSVMGFFLLMVGSPLEKFSGSVPVAHIQGIPCKYYFFVTDFKIPLKMWASKYLCGPVKLGKLGPHKAPGVLNYLQPSTP